MYSASQAFAPLASFTHSSQNQMYAITRGAVVAATNIVSLDDAKDHLRIDTSDEDDLITASLEAAVEICEAFTGNSFQRTTYTITTDCLMKHMQLPTLKWPAITQWQYRDDAGDQQTISSSTYNLDEHTGRVTFPAGPPDANSQDWPGGVIITCTAGWDIAGTGATAYLLTPKALIAAVKLTLGHLYENRQDVTDFQKFQLPKGAERLMKPYRSLRAG